MQIVKPKCYIYAVFYQSKIVRHLKKRLKAVTLITALLVSFFCLSGYVRPSVACNGPATSGQVANAAISLKSAIAYKRALSSFYKSPKTNSLSLKQREIDQRFLAISFATRHACLSAYFISFKPALAYSVRHISLAACNG